MKAFVGRNIVLFLIFWLGFSLLECLPTFRDHYRHNPEITRLKLETKRIELAETELQINLLRTKQETGRYLVLVKKAELYLATFKGWITFTDKEIHLREAEIARLEKENKQDSQKLQQLGDARKGIQAECDSLRRLCEDERQRYGYAALLCAVGAAFAAKWGSAACCVVGMLLALVVLKLLAYYAAAPVVEKLDAITPFSRVGSTGPAQDITGERGVKLVNLDLPPGESLLVRDEKYTGGYEEYADSELEKRTQILFSWKYWLMSWLCGLCILTRFTNKSSTGRTHSISITSDDPDEYFTAITLAPGERCSITPSDLVAFSGSISIFGRWRAWLPAWCMGQIRHYVLAGPGMVVVRAEGGITGDEVHPGKVAIRRKHCLISASQGVLLHVRRTETLIPYLLGITGLFDLRLMGNGNYRIRNVITAPRSVADRASHLFLEGLGKFLGF